MPCHACECDSQKDYRQINKRNQRHNQDRMLSVLLAALHTDRPVHHTPTPHEHRLSLFQSPPPAYHAEARGTGIGPT